MVSPVEVSDLESRWRLLSDAETIVAQALLDDAWAVVLSRIPDVETRDGALVRAVLCAMVLRVMRNPDGKRQESIDDYSWTIDDTRSSGALYLSEQEMELLTPESSSGAFTIRPAGDPGWTQPDLWYSTTEHS